MESITTGHGTTVTLDSQDQIFLAHSEVPELAPVHAGRVLNGGFRPVAFPYYALRPDALRAIATLTEQTKGR
ncbi:hypothetical protein [Arthrobacter rhombi]|uniref:hypothetical protein n=1 Tax=Arthrobacter rhombi TaxID=71253 RepID=UPI003FD16248